MDETPSTNIADHPLGVSGKLRERFSEQLRDAGVLISRANAGKISIPENVSLSAKGHRVKMSTLAIERGLNTSASEIQLRPTTGLVKGESRDGKYLWVLLYGRKRPARFCH